MVCAGGCGHYRVSGTIADQPIQFSDELIHAVQEWLAAKREELEEGDDPPMLRTPDLEALKCR